MLPLVHFHLDFKVNVINLNYLFIPAVNKLFKYLQISFGNHFEIQLI